MIKLINYSRYGSKEVENTVAEAHNIEPID